MITQEQAIEAEQVFKWCDDLERSAAFREIVLKDIAAKRDEHERAGTDFTRKPRERAEHHRALHLAREILGWPAGGLESLVTRRKAEAKAVLEAWQKQEGRTPLVMATHRNV